MSFLSELWQFLKVRKKMWLLPILVIMAILMAVVLVGSNPAIAPFIYTLF